MDRHIRRIPRNYKEILLSMVTPFFQFSIFPLNRNPPKQVHFISAKFPPSNFRKRMKPVVNKLLSFKPPQYESSHHKQDLLITSPHEEDFSLLALTSNYKVIRFSPEVSLNVNRTTISPIIMGNGIPGLAHLFGRQGKHVWW